MNLRDSKEFEFLPDKESSEEIQLFLREVSQRIKYKNKKLYPQKSCSGEEMCKQKEIAVF